MFRRGDHWSPAGGGSPPLQSFNDCGRKTFTEVIALKSNVSANSFVCGTRQLPCLERLRHLPTTVHSAPSLSLPQAALRLEATPAYLIVFRRGDHWSPAGGGSPPLQLCNDSPYFQRCLHYSTTAQRPCQRNPGRVFCWVCQFLGRRTVHSMQ